MSLKRDGSLQIGSLLALFTGPIYIPVIYEHFYMSAMPKFAWHSPTQQLMLMCALISLLLFFKLYENYMEHMNPAVWVMLLSLHFGFGMGQAGLHVNLSTGGTGRLIIDLFEKRSIPAERG